MFSDFDDRDKKEEGRGRMGVSLGISMLVFAGLAALIGTAVATAHTVIRKRREVEVSFENLPPPPKVEAPKPPPKAVKNKKRKKAKRKHIKPPQEIPAEVPQESDDELVAAEDVGPVDGVINCEPGEDCEGGGEGGLEPPPAPERIELDAEPSGKRPAQQRETVSRPKLVAGCRGFEPPRAVQEKAATLRIKVRILVGADGRPARATVLESDPLIPDAMIIDCAMAQIFEPARLPDGLAVPYPLVSRFVFRPSAL